MASYKNFKNAYRRRGEQDNEFLNPKKSSSNTISEKKRNNIIDWVTFYRRNMHRFIEHYLGIKLHPYQVIWIYMMSMSDSFIAICARGTSKTWLLAVFACAKAILYPNSKIVVVSSTKEQAGIIVSEKITNLCDNYPLLKREISNIVSNMNMREVTFHNGSYIRVVASRDSSRGRRSTFTIYEEFVLIDKEILDAVIRPFSEIRPVPYLTNDIYKKYGEEYKEVFISSSSHKSLWWFEETKKVIKAVVKGDDRSNFIALDYAVAVRHNIKSLRSIKNDISRMDEITVLEQIYNIPWGESATAYFRLKMFDKARNIKKAFYPQRVETYQKKNPYAIAKIDGEIRILSCDTSMRGGSKNDLSVTSCIRLLPTSRGYFRELVYMESFSGANSISQTLRIKQVFYDFEADYIVLDVAAGGGGLPLYDMLGQNTKDENRGIEYPPMTIMVDSSIDPPVYEELSKRTLALNSIPVVYPISATAKLNSLIAVQLRDKLQKKLFGFLVDESSAEDYLIRSSYSKEFLSQEDPNARSFYLNPYLQTSLMVNQCIDLSMTLSSGNLKLMESPGNLKDRFSSLAYGNYFAFLLDQTLIRENDNEDDFEFISKLIQSV